MSSPINTHQNNLQITDECKAASPQQSPLHQELADRVSHLTVNVQYPCTWNHSQPWQGRPLTEPQPWIESDCKKPNASPVESSQQRTGICLFCQRTFSRNPINFEYHHCFELLDKRTCTWARGMDGWSNK